nr:reverse transcriptase domain-containing protein [Tanacetum cinerariifolium]
MSTMANSTPIVTTVTKTANKEKTPKEADAALKANMLDFSEEHYEDILPVIMDKIHRDKRKEVHARLDFKENPRKSRRARDGSQNSSAGTLPARYHNPSKRPKMWDCLKFNDEDVFDRMGHRRQSAFDRLSNTYSPSTTKSGPNEGNSRDHSHSRGHSRRRGSYSRDRPRNRNRPRGIKESYGAARVWFDELPPESIDGYKGLKAAFLAYFMQQKKYVKDLVEIYNIKQRDGKTIKEFIEHFKIETGRMKRAPECMRIFGFIHGVNNPELTKRLNEYVPKNVEEMMTTTTAFIRGETAAASKKKVHTPWKSHDQSKRHTSERRSDFRNRPKDGRGSNKFTPLTRTSKEIFMTESGKFKPPPPMLRKQIEELRVTQQKVTQTFAHVKEITFPPLTTNKGIEGLLVIEVEIAGHAVHRIYVDGGSSMEILYEHCFNRIWPKIKNQMVLTTTSLTGFSGETIWPLRQLRLLVTIGGAEHYTKAWKNFMIVRSQSSYNGIIGRPEIREIQAVPSTAHEMLKFPVNGRIVTICSTILTRTECATIAATPKDSTKKTKAHHENFKVAIHPDFLDQEITIRGTVSTKARTKSCTLLKGNLDIFAWQPSDMTGVPRSIAEHRLDI